MEEPLALPPTERHEGPARPLEETTPVDGKRMGAYRLIREIGEGGMSTVYLAARDDDTFQRQVAIKIIRGNMESREARRRLRAECGGVLLDGRHQVRFRHGSGTDIAT